MRVHVVSDVHGNAEALARAGDGADALLVLGDLLDFIDYREPGKGIMGRIFGAEKVTEFIRLRTEGLREQAGVYIRGLWDELSDGPRLVSEAITEEYARLFTALSAPAYATAGNVDSPELWRKIAAELGTDLRLFDGESIELGGLRIGFVGGALRLMTFPPTKSHWQPYLRSPEEFDAAVAGLPPVDILATHIPPAVAELTYDVVARRSELGSYGLLEKIRADRPRWSLFGHVHQPLSGRVRIGPTECVNVGHFKRWGRPYVINW
ncbi:metallophosphoesterase [Pseudonocardiaceae bacterium YIM PH 21723]|nr:metallophosphoesterase [Pseudonocardiaceae bacterium YIM PH 21723]